MKGCSLSYEDFNDLNFEIILVLGKNPKIGPNEWLILSSTFENLQLICNGNTRIPVNLAPIEFLAHIISNFVNKNNDTQLNSMDLIKFAINEKKNRH